MSLPATGFGFPLTGRLTPSGEIAETSLVMIAADTGRYWRATLSGNPPVWQFNAVPDVADIRVDFATVVALRNAVASVAQLRTWGFS